MYRETKTVNLQEIALMIVYNDGEDWQGHMKKATISHTLYSMLHFLNLTAVFRKFQKTSHCSKVIKFLQSKNNHILIESI